MKLSANLFVIKVVFRERMMKLIAFVTLMTCLSAFCGPVEDARQLHKEAQDILRASSGTVADPKVYAEAVKKLQKAQALLEDASKAGAGNDSLEQEVSASLFWARRFCNVNVLNELNKTSPSKDAPKAVDPGGAEAAYRKAEEYERTHNDDDYAIALRWFQFSTEYSGTDWSLRALALARAAQARQAQATKKNAPAGSTEPAEYRKLMSEGEILFQLKKYDEALAKFMDAKKSDDTVPVNRSVGNTYVELGHGMRDQYGSEYIPLLKQYQAAVQRKDIPTATRLSAQAKELVARLKPLEQKALKSYDLAQAQFQHGLELAKGKDLECEAQIAILYFDRGRDSHVQAKLHLAEMLAKYSPANDEERTVYEYSKALYREMK